MLRPSKTKRSAIRWTKRVVLIVAAIGILVMIVRAVLPDPVLVDTAVATRGPLEVEVREDGQTRVRDRYVVAAPTSGQLERVTIDAGTHVEEGTIVARIDPSPPPLLDARVRRETQARLAVAEARERQAGTAVARARQSKDLAAADARRTRALYEGGASSSADSERATTRAKIAAEELTAAEHERAAAAAEVLALRATLEPGVAEARSLEVTAPSRGTVLRVLRESAGPVAAGTPLLEIGDPSSLEIVIDVLSRDAERIEPGMPVYIDTAAARPVRGTVKLVEPSAFTRVSALGVEEQRVNVIACFDAAPTLGDAFRVDARIIVWRGEDVLRVPASALFRDRGRWAVYVVAGGRARLRSVEIGNRGRLDVEVTRGLAAGERVVVHPSDQIEDTKRVALRD